MTAGERAPSRRTGLGFRDGGPDGSDGRSPRFPRDRADLLWLVAIAIAALAMRAVPILIGGGLFGFQGYDDGVYFGAAVAFVHGLVPYRDFALLHPPGIVLGLSPFAMLGTLTGDATAFALARASILLLGAANAVLVALIAGRYDRLAGLTAGALYAVWITAIGVERSTDLHGPQTTLLLLALLLLARPGPIGPRRAALTGVALGLATTIQLWQAVSVVVVLGWIVLRTRRTPGGFLRPAVAFVLGAGVAFGLVCLPFLAADPEAMIRYTLVDQLGRPNMGIDTIERLRVLEGIPLPAQLPALMRQLVWDPVVLILAVGALALVVVTAWRRPWSRLWAALAIVQSAVILATPSFYHDYPGFVAPAATLVLGTGLAAGAQALTRRGLRPLRARAPLLVLLSLLVAVSLVRREGEPLPLAALERDVAQARCVTADTPALLVLTSALRRDIEAGCRLVLDPTGISYDTDRGRLMAGDVSNARAHATAYQQAMIDWYTSGDAALFARSPVDGLTPATIAAIQRRLPVERRRGIVTERLAAPP
jgi:alpha-1,2-mannosyltransferase